MFLIWLWKRLQCSELLKEKYSPHHWKVIYLKINFVPITTAGKLIYKFSLYHVLRFQRVLVTQPFGSCFRCTSTSSSKMGAALLKTTSSSKLATHMWCSRTGSQTEAALVLLILVTCLLWYCIDTVGRDSVLVTHGSERVNPLTPMSDQDRISPYNINTISCWQVMRMRKNIN